MLYLHYLENMSHCYLVENAMFNVTRKIRQYLCIHLQFYVALQLLICKLEGYDTIYKHIGLSSHV